jgi:hypothetical protein
MSGWSPEDTMGMERRQIAEGEERVARQDVLTGELIEKGYYRSAQVASELLKHLYGSLELSRERLRYLEGRYRKLSN